MCSTLKNYFADRAWQLMDSIKQDSLKKKKYYPPTHPIITNMLVKKQHPLPTTHPLTCIDFREKEWGGGGKKPYHPKNKNTPETWRIFLWRKTTRTARNIKNYARAGYLKKVNTLLHTLTFSQCAPRWSLKKNTTWACKLIQSLKGGLRPCGYTKLLEPLLVKWWMENIPPGWLVNP